MGRPARLTSRPGRLISRVRTVRATVKWSSTRTLPRVVVQRIRLWASTVHCSQAELAWKLPDGTCSRPAPSFQVADGELDDGVVTVEAVDVDGVTGEVGDKGVVTPVGPQPLLGVSVRRVRRTISRRVTWRRPLAGGVGALGDLGLTVDGVVDVDPGVVGNRRDRCGDPCRVGAHGHRVAHVEAPQGGDRVVGPEPRVDPHGESRRWRRHGAPGRSARR